MQWSDEGIILGARPHGETHAIAEIFCPGAGRVTGLVHGGQGRQRQPLLQTGNQVRFEWKGRGENALGHFALELEIPRAAALMQDADALAAISSVCALLSGALPERQSMPRLYEAALVLLDHLEEPVLWPVLMVKWEMGLLSELGYGLTLDRCAATGELLEDGAVLTFVSPKSATAVSYEAGLPYKDKLLPLPPFLIDQGVPQAGDVVAAFRLTANFLESRVFEPAGKPLPEPRQRLQARLERVLARAVPADPEVRY